MLVNGSKQQQDMALVALAAIDKPQDGYADEVAFLGVFSADEALTALKELYETLSVRKLSSDRLPISGDRPLVDKALATATISASAPTSRFSTRAIPKASSA